MTRAAWDATPTDYQARLLLAALDDSQHRIPSDAKKRTLEIMSGRHEWVRARRLTSTLAAVESDATEYVLTHHGVNAANRARTAQLAALYPVATPAVYVPEEGEEHRDIVVVMSKPAADGTVEVHSVKHGGPVRVPLAGLRELPPLPPEPEGELTDWWVITDAEGSELARVEAEDDPGARKVAMRHGSVVAAVRRDKGFAVRRLRTSELSIPVGELHGLPRISPAAAPAAPVHWWAVKDREGNLITQVEATSYDHAVQVADQDPKVRAARPGAGGLVFMQLGSIEKPAPAAAQPRETVPAAAPARRTITVTTGFTRKSIPTRLRESGAPGQMKYSDAAGALRWVLPNGQELTPGQAEEMFLR
ncbi:hypothetical protein ACIQVK_44270 [Streptomyces sp. NPDC090493]|uniref:hypothetical protein n=1 Tax=Streptomyces sp. NPDC090493 TaxID=3365964 RepID=UPI00381751F4